MPPRHIEQMENNTAPALLNIPQLQELAIQLLPYLRTHLQREAPSSNQDLEDSLAYQIRQIVKEEHESLLQNLQGALCASYSPPLYATQNVPPRPISTASADHQYVILPSAPLSPAVIAFQGGILHSLRSTPSAMLRQALSSRDITELLQYRAPPSTYLPLLDVSFCKTVDRKRNFNRGFRAARSFEFQVRAVVRKFGHLIKDTRLGALLERSSARLLGLAIERECANFGATPLFIDRARLYTVRVTRMKQYLRGLCDNEEGALQLSSMLSGPVSLGTGARSALVRQNQSIGLYVTRNLVPEEPQHILRSSTVTPLATEAEPAPVEVVSSVPSRCPLGDPPDKYSDSKGRAIDVNPKEKSACMFSHERYTPPLESLGDSESSEESIRGSTNSSCGTVPTKISHSQSPIKVVEHPAVQDQALTSQCALSNEPATFPVSVEIEDTPRALHGSLSLGTTAVAADTIEAPVDPGISLSEVVDNASVQVEQQSKSSESGTEVSTGSIESTTRNFTTASSSDAIQQIIAVAQSSVDPNPNPITPQSNDMNNVQVTGAPAVIDSINNHNLPDAPVEQPTQNNVPLQANGAPSITVDTESQGGMDDVHISGAPNTVSLPIDTEDQGHLEAQLPAEPQSSFKSLAPVDQPVSSATPRFTYTPHVVTPSSAYVQQTATLATETFSDKTELAPAPIYDNEADMQDVVPSEWNNHSVSLGQASSVSSHSTYQDASLPPTPFSYTSETKRQRNNTNIVLNRTEHTNTVMDIISSTTRGPPEGLPQHYNTIPIRDQLKLKHLFEEVVKRGITPITPRIFIIDPRDYDKAIIAIQDKFCGGFVQRLHAQLQKYLGKIEQKNPRDWEEAAYHAQMVIHAKGLEPHGANRESQYYSLRKKGLGKLIAWICTTNFELAKNGLSSLSWKDLTDLALSREDKIYRGSSSPPIYHSSINRAVAEFQQKDFIRNYERERRAAVASFSPTQPPVQKRGIDGAQIEQQSAEHIVQTTPPPKKDVMVEGTQTIASSSPVDTTDITVDDATTRSEEDMSPTDRLMYLVSQGVQRLSSHAFSYMFQIGLEDSSIREVVSASLIQKKRWGKDLCTPGVETALSKVEEALKDDCIVSIEGIIYLCADAVFRQRIECKNPKNGFRNISERRRKTEALFQRIAGQNLALMRNMKVPKPMSWNEIKEQAEAADKDAFRFSCNWNENMRKYDLRMQEWVDKWSKMEYVEQHISPKSASSPAGLSTTSVAHKRKNEGVEAAVTDKPGKRTRDDKT